MCKVEEGGRRSEIGMVEVSDEASVEVRCLPAWTRRISDVGADVRNESSWRSVGIVVSEGTVRGIAVSFVSFGLLCWQGLSDVLSPDRSLTKIWKSSEDGDEDVDVEETFDDERELRMLDESVEDYGIDRYVAQDCCMDDGVRAKVRK